MLKATQVRTNTHLFRRSHWPQLQHIMIIADQLELAETLQMELNREGFQVSIISDGIRGLLAVKRVATDLVVVGWSPPRISGLEICQRLRASQGNSFVAGDGSGNGSGNGSKDGFRNGQNHSQAHSHHEPPIILLTQHDDVKERIAGLEAGANDCLSLPCDREELLARIHANLLRNQPSRTESAVLRCADIQLNRRTREVFRGERLIRLTAKEFDLLEYLMHHYFQVLTRSQILENVWGYEYTGSSNIIEVYIRYLRRKLESEKEARLIHTVRSVGYIFREDNSREDSLREDNLGKDNLKEKKNKILEQVSPEKTNSEKIARRKSKSKEDSDCDKCA